MFFIFRYIAICSDKWKQAVLFKESYRYIDMPHINDTPCFYLFLLILSSLATMQLLELKKMKHWLSYKIINLTYLNTQHDDLLWFVTVLM